jgi:hypothetical protein
VERRRALRGRRYTANAVQDLPSDAARLTANVYERIIMSDDVSNTYAMKNVPGSLHTIKTLLPKEKKTLKIISISKNTPPPLSRLRKLHKKTIERRAYAQLRRIISTSTDETTKKIQICSWECFKADAEQVKVLEKQRKYLSHELVYLMNSHDATVASRSTCKKSSYFGVPKWRVCVYALKTVKCNQSKGKKWKRKTSTD